MLKINNIDVFYGKLLQALYSVSLEVNEGEIVALLGSNGAGKSTTLKTVSGLLQPTNGTIEFQNQPIHGKTPEEIVGKIGISHCPEGRRVFADMTVEENLAMGAYLIKDRGVVKKQFEMVYNLFSLLADRKKQRAGTMSGGEQQMLAVGRSLMSKPDLLMLDEPSLGLAPMLVAGLGNQIKEINESGITILLVEQNARMALSVADRAYVLEVGRIALKGKADKLSKDDRVRKAYLGI